MKDLMLEQLCNCVEPINNFDWYQGDEYHPNRTNWYEYRYGGTVVYRLVLKTNNKWTAISFHDLYVVKEDNNPFQALTEVLKEVATHLRTRLQIVAVASILTSYEARKYSYRQDQETPPASTQG